MKSVQKSSKEKEPTNKTFSIDINNDEEIFKIKPTNKTYRSNIKRIKSGDVHIQSMLSRSFKFSN